MESRHIAKMIAAGVVRPGTKAELPEPVKPKGEGKTASEYVSECRR